MLRSRIACAIPLILIYRKKLLDHENDSIGMAEANWLLIFDNADDPDVLMDYIHVFGSGSVLVTSRHPLAKESFTENSLSIDLQPFKDEDAKALLRKIAGLARQLDKAKGLEMLTYSEFFSMYKDHTEISRLFSFEMQLQQPTARGNVATTIWAIEELSLHARSLSKLFSFLDPDSTLDSILD
ncbi:MAG: hypothetical protein MMC33_002071 [Icmadophila ericetorum]|nr:hypothetical protein [Icmadophila ericetorum]